MSDKVIWELACVHTWIEAQNLAADGWEFVSVTQHPSGEAEDWIRFYFKREVKK